MIPLTILEYELGGKPEKVFSRLNWAVEEIEYDWMDDLNNLKTSPATHKDWIGEIDEYKLRFRLEEPGTLFKRKFSIVVKGDLEERASTTNVKIRVGLENFSFVWIFLIYLMTAMIIYDAFTSEEFDSYISISFFVAAFPILGTIVIARRMKRTEHKLDKLFWEDSPSSLNKQ